MIMEFTDALFPGVEMSDEKVPTETTAKRYPAYLRPDNADNPIVLKANDRIDPTKLRPNSAYVYHDILYVTDCHGQIAYIDAELRKVQNPSRLRDTTAQRKVGGKGARHDNMDAGHLVPISLGSHPSMVVEQSSSFNRYLHGKNNYREDWQQGMFRDLELDWSKQVARGDSVNVKAVYTQADEDNPGTYSPEWCYQVENRTTNERFQYNMINEAGAVRDEEVHGAHGTKKEL